MANALEKIVNYQNSTALLLIPTKFSVLARRMIDIYANMQPNDVHVSATHEPIGLRISRETIRLVQQYIEHRIVIILRKALNMAAHAKRDGVAMKDVQLVYTTLFNAPLPESQEPIQEFKNGLKRLCFRAGIHRTTSTLQQACYDILVYEMQRYLMRLVYITMSRNVTTIKPDIIQWINEHNPEPIY